MHIIAPSGPEPLSGRPVVSLLGPVRLTLAGQDARLRSRKARALLAYLLLSGQGLETRERLVGLLWSEAGEVQARASLRQALHELRESLEAVGCDALRGDRLSVSFAAGATTDVEEVLSAAEAGLPHPLLATPRLGERLLEGLDDLDPAFRGWLQVTRQGFQDRLMRSLEAGMRRDSQPPAARMRLAEAILRLDPTQEEACRCLMRLAAEAGDTAGALRAYDTLWKLLEEDYDSKPSEQTQALVAEIKLGRIGPRGPAPVPASPVASGAPARIALLVEPFALNGVAEGQIHLAQGFRHDLIACLVRFREWFVVDGPTLPPPEQIAARVSGRYRVSATAYQVGDRISQVLTLADQGSGILIWSERMELRLDGWFEAHRDIVRRIATALNLQISSSRLQRLSMEPDVSLESYDRWLRATAMIRRFSPENWARARLLFEECMAETPGFSSAWAGLAQMENSAHIIHPGERRSRAREAHSVELARRAVQLDPTDSRAHLTLGWSLIMSGQHSQAKVPVQLACELNPYDSWTLISAAMHHAFNGEHALARSLAEQSLEQSLMPQLIHWGYQVSIAFLAGDEAGTLEAYDRAQDVIRTLPAWRAAALARLGRLEEARESAGRFLRLVRESWFAAEAPTDAAIVRWLLHLYPIRRAEEWQRFRDAIALAGLPVEGIRFGEW